MDPLWLFRTVDLRNLFRFGGRATRREFFAFLAIGLVAIVTGLLDLDSFSALPLIVLGLGLILAVSIRRVHDHGGSAWVLLGLFVPYVGFGVYAYFIFIPGEPFTNDFGADPRAQHEY